MKAIRMSGEFWTPGTGIKGRILVVVYCYSGENIRIISARTAGGRNAISIRDNDEEHCRFQQGQAGRSRG